MTNSPEDLEKRIVELEKEIKALKGKLQEKDILLKNIYDSKTWMLGQLYGKIFGTESLLGRNISKILNKLRKKNIQISKSEEKLSSSFKKKPSYSPVNPSGHHFARLSSFLNSDLLKGFFIVIANPKMIYSVDSRGDRISHRAVRLASEFAKKGYGVLYIYTEVNLGFAYDEIEDIGDNSIQMSVRLFSELYKYVFKHLNTKDCFKVLLIQFLPPRIISILSHANACNITTVYDVIDNWEEFYREGWHKSYSPRTEEFVINNVDIRITVSDFLKKKFSTINPDFHIVNNGYSPDMLDSNSHLKLNKGKITAGYIGNLERFRFDWELILSVAKKHSDWSFYLIGKMPSGIELPHNVISIGPVMPNLLYSYARNWDVGIIPFKINNLTLSCDNLKVYEYLYFGLPVVARGIGEHAGRYPYVYIARDEIEFERLIQDVSLLEFDRNKLSEFLNNALWPNRAEEMIGLINKEKPVYKEYIFENIVHQ